MDEYNPFDLVPDGVKSFFDSVLDFGADVGARVVNQKTSDFFGFSDNTKGSGDPIIVPASAPVAGRPSQLSPKDLILIAGGVIALVFLIRK